nr:multivesicular body subunit 12B isoform X6 [Phascolarctos cinereus]
MKLIDIKDTLPVGFIPIQETVDTQEVAFRKKRLCIKFIPRDSTEAAICDIRIMGRTKQAPPQYTFIGELNNMGIWYRMGRVPRNHESPQPTTPSPSSASTPAPNLPRHISLTLPATFRGRNSTRTDYEYQHSNLYAISAMDGVPFMISEKFSCVPESMQPIDLLGITIKSLAEIEKERRKLRPREEERPDESGRAGPQTQVTRLPPCHSSHSVGKLGPRPPTGQAVTTCNTNPMWRQKDGGSFLRELGAQSGGEGMEGAEAQDLELADLILLIPHTDALHSLRQVT